MRFESVEMLLETLSARHAQGEDLGLAGLIRRAGRDGGRFAEEAERLLDTLPRRTPSDADRERVRALIARARDADMLPARARAAADLARRIEALPPRQRDVARLSWIDGLSPRAIAERLGVGPNAVNQALFRARKSIVAPLAPQLHRRVLGATRPGPTSSRDLSAVEPTTSPLLGRRVERRLSVDEVVGRITDALEIFDNAGRERVRRYYQRLEAGLLDHSRVDTRILSLLEQTLGLGSQPLGATGGRAALGGQLAFYRSRRPGGSDGLVHTAPDLVGADPEAGHRDEIDHLFLGKDYSVPQAHALRARYLAIFGGPEFPVPVRRIAEDLLGLRIVERSGLDVSGMVLPAERCIVLNADERTEGSEHARSARHTWTVAHELGHWVKHVEVAARPEPFLCRQAETPTGRKAPMEREADLFAAELLLPEDAVRERWQEIVDGAADRGTDALIGLCAERFGVSAVAMHYRLFNFRLVPEMPPPYVPPGQAASEPR